MSNSSLVTYTKIAPSKTSPRRNEIKKITIHHMAGNLSVKTCGNVFQSTKSSTNYGIDNDGEVGLYVDENDRSWASSSSSNDHQAITMEVANCGGAPDWKISDVALEKTIELCTDICKRNGIEKLIYTGDETGNLTRHNMFIATTCPGPYLQSKFDYIADNVNARLNGEVITTNTAIIEKDDKLEIDGSWGKLTTTALQEKLGTIADGVVSNQSKFSKKYHQNCSESSWEYGENSSGSSMIKALQTELGVTVDGKCGVETSKVLQKFLNVTQDGFIGEITVKALQTWISKEL
ncbi:MAG: peptidoglycan recognition family protein [Clostridia bacterium]